MSTRKTRASKPMNRLRSLARRFAPSTQKRFVGLDCGWDEMHLAVLHVAKDNKLHLSELRRIPLATKDSVHASKTWFRTLVERLPQVVGDANWHTNVAPPSRWLQARWASPDEEDHAGPRRRGDRSLLYRWTVSAPDASAAMQQCIHGDKQRVQSLCESLAEVGFDVRRVMPKSVAIAQAATHIGLRHAGVVTTGRDGGEVVFDNEGDVTVCRFIDQGTADGVVQHPVQEATANEASRAIRFAMRFGAKWPTADRPVLLAGPLAKTTDWARQVAIGLDAPVANWQYPAVTDQIASWGLPSQSSTRFAAALSLAIDAAATAGAWVRQPSRRTEQVAA